MKFIVFIPCLALMACTGVGVDRAIVTGVGTDELLKLRSGPGLEFNIIVGLPDGTILNRQNCVTELGQRWCRVTLADAPRGNGYVSADYLGAG
jgi:uncharacterized protein YraI